MGIRTKKKDEKKKRNQPCFAAPSTLKIVRKERKSVLELHLNIYTYAPLMP
jgi:hypothetical protein